MTGIKLDLATPSEGHMSSSDNECECRCKSLFTGYSKHKHLPIEYSSVCVCAEMYANVM